MCAQAASLRILRDWQQDLHRARPSVDWQEAGLVLTLDPGETTGWAMWDHGLLVTCGQASTPTPEAMSAFLRNTLDEFVFVEHIVYEEYRVRSTQLKVHVGSEVVTIQHIGVIKVLADFAGIPTTKQQAGEAKRFASDTKLRRWGLYQVGLRHANDAIRHGVYFHLFRYGRKARRTGGLQSDGESSSESER